jgi:hypothetical protein
MDDLTAEIKRLLEEDDPTITVQEFIPQPNDKDSTPYPTSEPNGSLPYNTNHRDDNRITSTSEEAPYAGWQPV